MYVKTNEGIYDVTYWNKDDKGYYTYYGDDWCEPKHYIYNDDIIKKADNLEDLIDEFRYDYEYSDGSTSRYRCEQYIGCNGEPYWYNDNFSKDVEDYELPTVKGYIWIGDDLICVAKMEKYGDGYKLFLKER